MKEYPAAWLFFALKSNLAPFPSSVWNWRNSRFWKVSCCNGAIFHKTQNTTLLFHLFTCPHFILFALCEFFLNCFPCVLNCVLFLTRFSTLLVCSQIPLSLLSVRHLSHCELQSAQVASRWLALSGGCSFHALLLPGWCHQCHSPFPLGLLSVMLAFQLTVKRSMSA